MKKETKEMLLANGTWMAIGIGIGFLLGYVVAIGIVKSMGLL